MSYLNISDQSWCTCNYTANFFCDIRYLLMWVFVFSTAVTNYGFFCHIHKGPPQIGSGNLFRPIFRLYTISNRWDTSWTEDMMSSKSFWKVHHSTSMIVSNILDGFMSFEVKDRMRENCRKGCGFFAMQIKYWPIRFSNPQHIGSIAWNTHLF